jgi:Malectin domain
MATVTNVLAFEQIYAINAGGPPQIDEDGIVYKNKTVVESFNWSKENLKNVPKSAFEIYKWMDMSKEIPIVYEIPLENNGLYVLITKFSFYGDENYNSQSAFLNNIELFSNVNLYKLCSDKSICDKYYYFCVTNQTLHFQNQSSNIQNGKIHVEIRPVKHFAHISGLVLLKGSIDEHKRLVSSASTETLDFNALNSNPVCQKAAGKLSSQPDIADITTTSPSPIEANEKPESNRIPTTTEYTPTRFLSDTTTAIPTVEPSFEQMVQTLKHQYREDFEQFKQKISQFSNTSFTDLANQLFDQAAKIQKNTLLRVEEFHRLDQDKENQTGQMSIALQQFGTELNDRVSKNNQTIENIELLRMEIQALGKKQKDAEELDAKIKAGEANLKLQLAEMNKRLNAIGGH